MVARPLWLHTPELGEQWSPLAAWLTEPGPAGPRGLGVVVLPPVGYEYSSSHRFWRSLAEALAERDITTLRVDYPGAGDSAGLVADVQDLQPWRSTLTRAAAELAARGITRLVIVGSQLGATFVLADGPALQPVGIVTIAPVLSGRRFVRGLSMIGRHAPDDVGGVAHGGYYFSAGLLDAISALSASPPTDIPHLSVDDARTTAFMQGPAEEATTDPQLVAEVADWIAALDADADADADAAAAAVAGRGEPAAPESASLSTAMLHEGVVIREEIVTVGPDELIGVVTAPADTTGIPDEVYLLVNSGSDPHVGPGRSWVEMARELAVRGRATLRMDLRGWGESPDGPSVPGRPGDPHTLGDIARLIAALDDGGRRHIVCGGLCAGAWVTMATARSIKMAGLVVLNPQLYWQPGDPVEALMSTSRARRKPEIAWIKEFAALGRWDEEDIRGLRPPAGEWLDDLVRIGRPTSMIFAEGDDGLEYLRDRLSRRLDEVTETGIIRVVELLGVDHGMHRTWLRPVVFDTIAAELDKVLGLRV